MLGDPLFEVDGAAGIEALGLPLEVDFLTRGVSISHLPAVNDVFGVAVTRSFPACPLTGLPAGLFTAVT